MPGYISRGPFSNGGPPALDQTFFNGLESWINQAEATIGGSTISGSTSGTATLYQVLQGNFKLVIVTLATFRNGGAPAQTLAIPTPLTTCVFFAYSTNIGGPWQVLKASVAQGVQQLITLNAGADNITSAQTSIRANWFWHCDTGIDTISINGSQGSSASGRIIIFGI